MPVSRTAARKTVNSPKANFRICLIIVLSQDKDMDSVKRTKYAVYDTKYHLVWIPKYRKKIFNRMIAEYIKKVFDKIAEKFEFEIDTMKVMKDYVHLFLSAPPRYCPAQIVQIMKSMSAKQVFKRFPHLEEVLWNREPCSTRYFVRTGGDKVRVETKNISSVSIGTTAGA